MGLTDNMAKPPYFLGFDGGATKTSGALIDSEGKVLAEKTGGPSNFQIIGTTQASGNIMDVARMILEQANLKLSDISGILLGLTGAGRESEQQRMKTGFEEYLRGLQLPVPQVAVNTDALIALEGAFPEKAGMILISGTGSILLAKDKSGKVSRVGGWGRFVGDEGSGYAIGRAGLTAYVKEWDGRGNATKITQLVKEKLGIDSPYSLVLKIYQSKTPSGENFDIASAAMIVLDAASENDSVAVSILNDAANDLLSHISAALRATGNAIPIAFMGSVLSHQNYLVDRLHALISKEFPAVKIVKPEQSAAVGAALLARRYFAALK